MEDFESIVNRNHDKKTAEPKNEDRRKFIKRIVVSFMILCATFSALMFYLMHIYLAALVMLAAYTVGCISLGQLIHLIAPKS